MRFNQLPAILKQAANTKKNTGADTSKRLFPFLFAKIHTSIIMRNQASIFLVGYMQHRAVARP